MYEKYVQEYKMSTQIRPSFDFKTTEQPQLTQIEEELVVEKTLPQYDTDEEEKKGDDDEIFARGMPLNEVK